MELATMLLGSFLVLFLPGFLVSLVLFDLGKIDVIERAALSFALSIAIVPLVVFYTNLVGVKINRENVLGHILIICSLALIGIGIKLWLRQNYAKQD